MREKKSQIVLLLGSITTEGVTSYLKAVGREYRCKLLLSSTENWGKINKIFEKQDVAAILAKITPDTCDLIARKEYKEVGVELFDKISSVPHILYIFEGMLTGDEYLENPANEDEPYYTYPTKPGSIEHLKSIIESQNLNILSYKSTSDITISAQHFLEQSDSGLLFRIYMPDGHIFENELEKVFGLFRDYLSKISGAHIRLDQNRTNNGAIYAFHGNLKNESNDLSLEFDKFSNILDLCLKDPAAAEAVLVEKGIDTVELDSIITRYSKEAKRLYVDLKHIREQKTLSIRQKLEAELIDIIDIAHNSEIIDSIVCHIMPPISGINHHNLLPNLGQKTDIASLTLNLNPQIIHRVEGIVAQEISGTINYTIEDKQILKLIQEHGSEQSTELTSALQELKDTSAPKIGRVAAKLKIKRFLIGCASKAGDIGVSLLQKYIENQVFTP